MEKISQRKINNVLKYAPNYMRKIIKRLLDSKKLEIYNVKDRTIKKYQDQIEKDTNYYGFAAYHAIKDIYLIYMNSELKLSKEEHIIRLLHELIHIWQYETKWDWVLECDSQNFSYEDDPVEKEAIRKSIRYYNNKKGIH